MAMWEPRRVQLMGSAWAPACSAGGATPAAQLATERASAATVAASSAIAPRARSAMAAANSSTRPAPHNLDAAPLGDTEESNWSAVPAALEAHYGAIGKSTCPMLRRISSALRPTDGVVRGPPARPRTPSSNTPTPVHGQR